jgi:HSP20 family protein
LEAEIPGGASDKLELTVEGNTLTLSGELGFAEGKSQYHRRERPVGRFARAIRFPLGLDPAGVEAHYSDGILTVRLAKAPEAKARKIAVRAG